MAGQGQGQIVRSHTAAIILDPDQGFAAIRDVNFDPARARINGVFNELFDRGRRAFDNFARRDTVDRAIVELPNDRAGRTRAFLAYVGLWRVHTTIGSMLTPDSTTRKSGVFSSCFIGSTAPQADPQREMSGFQDHRGAGQPG